MDDPRPEGRGFFIFGSGPAEQPARQHGGQRRTGDFGHPMGCDAADKAVTRLWPGLLKAASPRIERAELPAHRIRMSMRWPLGISRSLEFTLQPERVCKSKRCLGPQGEYLNPIDREMVQPGAVTAS